MMLNVKLLTTSLLIVSCLMSFSAVKAMDEPEEIHSNITPHHHRLTEGEYLNVYPDETIKAAFKIETLEVFNKMSNGKKPLLVEGFLIMCNRYHRWTQYPESHSATILPSRQLDVNSLEFTHKFDVHMEPSIWFFTMVPTYSFSH